MRRKKLKRPTDHTLQSVVRVRRALDAQRKFWYSSSLYRAMATMPTNDTAMSDLRRHTFLAFFDDVPASQLAEAAQIITLECDDLIFHEGDLADSIYLVLKGTVRLMKKDSSGKPQFLAFVRPNDFFGEFGVLDGHPRSAGAFAAEDDTVLARLPRETVIRVFNTTGGQGVLKVALHIIAKVRDINERYVEERLRKERMTLIGEMADRIIHDLKSPFCVIQLVTDMLRRDPPEDLTEHCDLLESQLGRMQTLVEEILEFSRGRTQLNRKPLQIAEVLGRLQTYNHEYLDRMRVTLSVDAVPKTVEVDSDKLLRVFQNLINNAVEAFDNLPGKISIHTEDQGSSIDISVSDNGPGIPEAMRSTLFEPFATMGKAKGTGLGMAIAKSIVEAHGGTLTFETAMGSGTTFHIALPTPTAGAQPSP